MTTSELTLSQLCTGWGSYHNLATVSGVFPVPTDLPLSQNLQAWGKWTDPSHRVLRTWTPGAQAIDRQDCYLMDVALRHTTALAITPNQKELQAMKSITPIDM